MLDPLTGVNGWHTTVSAPIICRDRSTSDVTGVGSKPEFGTLAKADVGSLRVENSDESTVAHCK